MLNRKFMAAAILFVALLAAFQSTGLAFGKKEKKQAKFKVRIENISATEGISSEGGAKYPFALSPGMYIVTGRNDAFFKTGKKADAALERQAEDGNPEVLTQKFLTVVGSLNTGIFNVPDGAESPSPILPGGAFEFNFTAAEGMKLNLIAMYGQSNDLFYAPEKAFDLFVDGAPIGGDITDKFFLWDAGTEINQPPGTGDEQAPRQKSADTGRPENGKVGRVNDGFRYPEIKDVLRITIALQ